MWYVLYICTYVCIKRYAVLAVGVSGNSLNDYLRLSYMIIDYSYFLTKPFFRTPLFCSGKFATALDIWTTDGLVVSYPNCEVICCWFHSPSGKYLHDEYERFLFSVEYYI